MSPSLSTQAPCCVLSSHSCCIAFQSQNSRPCLFYSLGQRRKGQTTKNKRTGVKGEGTSCLLNFPSPGRKTLRDKGTRRPLLLGTTCSTECEQGGVGLRLRYALSLESLGTWLSQRCRAGPAVCTFSVDKVHLVLNLWLVAAEHSWLQLCGSYLRMPLIMEGVEYLQVE